MAWIESHQDIKDHPKTTRFRRRLGVSLPAAIGHLHMFWWWALSYAEDGDLSRIEDDIVAEACGWDGEAGEFIGGLIAAGFVEEDRQIHDWDAYTGRLRKQREQNRIRQQRWRANNGQVTPPGRPVTPTNALVTRDETLDNPATGPDLTGPDLTGPDHNPPVAPPAVAGEEDAADAAGVSETGAAKRKRSAGKSPAPDTFPLTDEHFAWALREVGFDRDRVERETQGFVDRNRAEGKHYADWHAAWRNWMRSPYRSPPGQKGSATRPTKSAAPSPETAAMTPDRY